ncbi:hypothetical protein [Phascolarctobacterium sp.]|uniref:hypothetical protein n=1 Tax=Phascolarctobacterium sp. TaxID=2049039 RepID=UPI00302DC0EE
MENQKYEFCKGKYILGYGPSYGNIKTEINLIEDTVEIIKKEEIFFLFYEKEKIILNMQCAITDINSIQYKTSFSWGWIVWTFLCLLGCIKNLDWGWIVGVVLGLFFIKTKNIYINTTKGDVHVPDGGGFGSDKIKEMIVYIKNINHNIDTNMLDS